MKTINKDTFLSVSSDPAMIDDISNTILSWLLDYSAKERKQHDPSKRISLDPLYDNVFHWFFPTENLDIAFSIAWGREKDPYLVASGNYNFVNDYDEILNKYISKKKIINISFASRFRKLAIKKNPQFRMNLYKETVLLLAHELQHYYQNLYIDSGKFSLLDYQKDYAKQAFPILASVFNKHTQHVMLNNEPNYTPSEEQLAVHISSCVWHFLIPSEIDAYVTSCYIQSKLVTLSFQKCLENKILALKKDFFGIDTKALGLKNNKGFLKIWQKVKQTFLDYAKLKYPMSS